VNIVQLLPDSSEITLALPQADCFWHSSNLRRRPALLKATKGKPKRKIGANGALRGRLVSDCFGSVVGQTASTVEGSERRASEYESSNGCKGHMTNLPDLFWEQTSECAFFLERRAATGSAVDFSRDETGVIRRQKHKYLCDLHWLCGSLENRILAEVSDLFRLHRGWDEGRPHWPRCNGIDADAILARELGDTFGKASDACFCRCVGNQVFAGLIRLYRCRIDNDTAGLSFGSAARVR